MPWRPEPACLPFADLPGFTSDLAGAEIVGPDVIVGPDSIVAHRLGPARRLRTPD